MAVLECKTTRNWANITTVTVCLHFLVLINLPVYCTSVDISLLNVIATPVAPIKVTLNTGKPATTTTATTPPSHTPHTLAPPPPVTVGPNPTAGLLCGNYADSDFDLAPLTSAEYWTFNEPGSCFDSYYSFDTACEYKVAFCKQLPPSSVGQETGIGIAQVSNKIGSHQYLLGGLSEIEQSSDEIGNQLEARFRHGDSVQCGGKTMNLQVVMHLHCNRDVHWLIPTTGQPGKMPSDTLVTLDTTTCTYLIEADYDGACIEWGLSAGTILIIIFFCLVVVYIVGGVIYNKFSGARGLELIPNYDMWRLFPSDVMGGFDFVWSIITCRRGRAKQEYDDL